MIVRKLKNINTYVVGRAHIKKGSPCQDRTKYVLNNNTHVLSLCDGAGSRTYSQYGAEITTEAACEYFSANFSKIYNVLSSDMTTEDERNAINEEFTQFLSKKTEEFLINHREMALDDLLCTLEFVAINGNKYIAGHCGDGVIGKLVDSRGKERLQVLSHPDNGAASNITYFINDKSGSKHLRFYYGNMNSVEGFILMSDGPEEVLYNKVKGLNPNTSIFFKAVRSGNSSESKKLIEKILTEKIAEISYDDLSVNLLVFADMDLSKQATSAEINDFFGTVYEDQIVIESGYYATIDLCRKQNGRMLFGKKVIDAIDELRGKCV